jgi:antitoxin HigA-1
LRFRSTTATTRSSSAAASDFFNGLLGRSRAEIARLLGVSRQTLHAILAEKAPVTPEMALRIGKLCGNGPELWLNLQARYDIERLSRVKREEIAAIPTLAAE